MSFDYDKLKKKHESGEQWASYSDLFMVLSVVFLLLYVTASLRTGTHTLQQQIQKQQLVQRAENAENQIKAYNNLKDNYLETSATEKEQKMYEQLMGKLDLLQEKNHEEASELRRKALENEKKEMALNKYQQIIRNIINANVLSKAKLKRRDRAIATQKETISEQIQTIKVKDLTIEEKEKVITQLDEEVENKLAIIEEKNSIIVQKQKILKQKQNEISKLNEDIADKKQEIESNKKKISKINNDLDQQIKALKTEQKRRKISKEKFLAKMKELKNKSKKEIAWLNRKNKNIRMKLTEVSDAVEDANAQLASANKTIEQQEKQKERLDKELNTVQSQKAELDAELSKVQTEVAQTKAELESTKKKFQAQVSQLEGQRKSLENQKRRLEGQKNLLKSQKDELKQINSQLANVNNKLDAEKKQLTEVTEKLSVEKENLAKEKSRLQGEKSKLQGEKQQLSADLKKAQEIINAKKKLANQISQNFSKNGIKASVDGKTGEVILAFGKSYFDAGSSHLKQEMEKSLEKLIPIYADSIFKDPKTARKIKSIDIIGYASPTYKGRYVNPNSTKSEDRKAMKYNTDLSIRRARSVFNYIVDKVNYQHQKKVQSLLKVSGRSYFSGALTGRAPAKEMSQKEFCKQYDCKKEQRVIIKFELD